MISMSINNQLNLFLLYKTRSKYRKFLTDYPGPEINKLQYTCSKSLFQFKYIIYDQELSSQQLNNKLIIDEQLKQSLYTYLESFGINQSLNALIEAYSLDKEQRSYMEFLKSMEKFLTV